jgi:hypothetical protein
VISLIEIKKYSDYKGPGEYIGRFNYFHELEASPLKNPFSGPMNNKSNLRRIKKFKVLLESLSKDSPEWKEIRRLKEIYNDKKELNLICWCHPLPCHGDVIKSAILGEIHPNSDNENLKVY